MLNHQNNYVGNSNMMNKVAAKSFDILTSLNILHNYFKSLIKLFSDLYPICINF